MQKPQARHKFNGWLSERASLFRKSSTPAEQKLWAVLKWVRLKNGVRFRRQQPIGPYIADFYCAPCKCVIEIDGSSHEAKQFSDKSRDDYMKVHGLRILRFTEDETVKNPQGVAETILHTLGLPVDPTPLSPPSRGGE